MASRVVLTVAAICTATLAQADTFAERWPTPSNAVDPVRVAQAPGTEPPQKVRQAFACHRIYFTQASVLGMQAMRRQCDSLEPDEERRRVGKI